MEFGEGAIEKVFYHESDGIFMLTEDTSSDFFKNYEETAKKMKDQITFIYSGI